jgi:REP element-mobilizing transposase RayT
MRIPRKYLLGEAGRANVYHVVTRTTARQIIFGDAERETFRKILLKQLRFSGVRCLAWCLMGNHIHLLLEVPDRDSALAGVSDDAVLARLSALKGEYSTRMLLGQVQLYRDNGHHRGVAEIAGRVRARLFDLSAFMKELKQKMTGAYRAAHGRVGTLWEGRFKSVLVEGRGEALRAVAAYIDLNPVRAGLVSEPQDYRWCSYVAAVAGIKGARSGLAQAVTGSARSPWRKVSAEYRKLLFYHGQARSGGGGPDGAEASRRGFSAEQIEAVWAEGGKLPLAVVLGCHVRYLTDGVVLGSAEFVDGFFERNREQFGPRRTSGARRMRGAEWGSIRTLRQLRVAPVTLPQLEAVADGKDRLG